MEIRDTVENDLKQLVWLYDQNYYGEDDRENDFNGMVDKFRGLSKDSNYKFVSVIEHGKLIGFCWAVINQFIVKTQRPAIIIWGLRVAPEYRKQGIGTAIIKYFEDYGKSINVDLVGLACDTANTVGQAFYKKNGYRYNCLFFYKHLKSNSGD